ncbi:MAG TPA: sensor histidine kinase [Caldilineae bacterium]|nr:sensor histidine kinase [Caldilineae bacterium]
MSASQNGSPRCEEALIAEVRAHLARLDQEDPARAMAFRQALAELLQEREKISQEKPQQGQELRRVKLHALRYREEEQARLARELKAGPGQMLANAVAELGACLPLLETDIDLVRRGLQALREELRAGLDQFRWLLSELEPPQLMKELGLIDSLRLYAQRLERRNGISIQMLLPEERPRFPPTMELGIYRILQEALHNAAKHGHASVLTLKVEREGDRWQFTVEDNGTGFDPEGLLYARGLVNMYEWARAFGGELEIRSRPGHGTRVTLIVDASEFQPSREEV